MYLPLWIGICLLLMGSAFFASSETSLFSLSRVQVQYFRRTSPFLHKLVDFFLTRPRRTLVTILVGNEIINLLTSVLVTVFYSRLFPEASWGKITLYTLATSTPLIMILGDITPKTMAVRFPKVFVKLNALPLRVIYALLAPLRVIFAAISGLFIRLIGGTPEEKVKELTEEELKTLIQEGAEVGIIGKEEQSLIFNVLRFSDAKVGQVMTPKEKVFSLSADRPLPEVIEEIKSHPFSRIPIYRDNPEQVVGILHAKDLLRSAIHKQHPFSIDQFLNRPLYINSDRDLESAFRELRAQRLHLAIVVNGQGKYQGIVTLDDLLEELFGSLGEEMRGRGHGP